MQTSLLSVAFARRLYGVFLDVTASSTCRQHSANVMKAQCMHFEPCESVERVHRIGNKNSVGTR